MDGKENFLDGTDVIVRALMFVEMIAERITVTYYRKEACSQTCTFLALGLRVCFSPKALSVCAVRRVWYVCAKLIRRLRFDLHVFLYCLSVHYYIYATDRLRKKI